MRQKESEYILEELTRRRRERRRCTNVRFSLSLSLVGAAAGLVLKAQQESTGSRDISS